MKPEHGIFWFIGIFIAIPDGILIILLILSFLSDLLTFQFSDPCSALIFLLSGLTIASFILDWLGYGKLKRELNNKLK